MKTYLQYVLFFLIVFPATAQDISTHKWKERVLIVMTTDTTSNEFKEQLRIFTPALLELKERKLNIYIATAEAYTLFNSEMNYWITGNAIFRRFKRLESNLELLLIGLDGGIKFRKYGPVSASEIFAIIDGMPMRQSELRNSKKGRK